MHLANSAKRLDLLPFWQSSTGEFRQTSVVAMTAKHVSDAVQECVSYAAQGESPTTAVFSFVRKLMDDRGWSEVDAREVGARALVELDNSQTSR